MTAGLVQVMGGGGGDEGWVVCVKVKGEMSGGRFPQKHLTFLHGCSLRKLQKFERMEMLYGI